MDFDKIEWRDLKTKNDPFASPGSSPFGGDRSEEEYIGDAIDRCVCLLNKHPESPASAIGLGETFIKVERLFKPNMFRVLRGRLTKVALLPPMSEKAAPGSKYSPDYLEYLRSRENIERVADLVEAVKRAQLGIVDGRFTEKDTRRAIHILSGLIPGMKDIHEDEKMRMELSDRLNAEDEKHED